MIQYFERVADLNGEKLGAYKSGQFRPSEEDFKPGFKEKIRFLNFFFFPSDNKSFDPSTLNCNSIFNKSTVCRKSVFIFG